MERNYDISKYIETVKGHEEFFKNYYFHSIIDLNLIKLDSILENGILSKNSIEKKGLISCYTHEPAGYCYVNGKDYISLVDFNLLAASKEGCTFSQIFESFSRHTLTSLSLMTDRNIKVFSEAESTPSFDDEVFAYDKITPDHIEGIILPESLTNKKITEVPFLAGDSHCYTEKNINHLIDCMEVYFQKQIPRDELLESVELAWDICYNEYERSANITSAVKDQKYRYGIDMKDILSEIMNDLWQEKIGIENPTYIDVIEHVNRNRYPIYEIKEKQLVKK